MHDLPKEYTLLFNGITEAEESLMKVYRKLIEAQQMAECLYINEACVNKEEKSVSA